mgnify:CR=1 FL=1
MEAEGVRRRTTAAGGPISCRVTSQNRHVTGQHPARRITAANLVGRCASMQLLPAPGPGERRMQASRRQGFLDPARCLAGEAGIAACAAPGRSYPFCLLKFASNAFCSSSLPCLPTDPSPRAGATITDKEFFPDLPSLLGDVGTRLGRLMQLVDAMEVANAAAAESADAATQQAAAERLAALSLGDSEESSLVSSVAATEASEAGGTSTRLPSKRLQWADGREDGQSTPRADRADQDGGEGGEGEGEGEDSAADAAAEGEKSLRKGFRRRTWAGPAWLDAVRNGKVSGGEV